MSVIYRYEDQGQVQKKFRKKLLVLAGLAGGAVVLLLVLVMMSKQNTASRSSPASLRAQEAVKAFQKGPDNAYETVAQYYTKLEQFSEEDFSDMYYQALVGAINLKSCKWAADKIAGSLVTTTFSCSGSANPSRQYQLFIKTDSSTNLIKYVSIWYEEQVITKGSSK